MLAFAVYENGGPAAALPLRHARLIGMDNLVVPGTVTFNRALLACERPDAGATAVGLVWPTRTLGDTWLQTCLLPASEKHYLLSLELARHRIMQFLVKLEEWGLTDLPAGDPALEHFERARAAFTRALVAGGGPEGTHSAEQDALAREALELALRAGDLIVERHSRSQLSRRLATAPPPPEGAAASSTPGQWLGCAVAPDRFADGLCRSVADSFDFLNVPMRWNDLEPEEGAYAYAKTDRWVEWAVRAGRLPVVGGPLVDLRPGCVPEWLGIWENDYETLRDLVFGHVRAVVTRYRRAVNRWMVVSAQHLNDHFRFSLEQAVDLTRAAVLSVRKLQPTAKIGVEIVQPFGESLADNPAAIPPLLYLDLLRQAQIPFDTIGVRIQIGEAQPGGALRDLLILSDLLDRFSVLETPIAISACGVPGAPPPAGAPGAERAALDPGAPPQGWSEPFQAEWLQRFVGAALAKPMVASVCWQGLYETGAPADMPAGALITREGKPRAALARAAAVRKALRDRLPVESRAPVAAAG